MHRIAWVLVAATLSIGASKCEEEEQPGPGEPPMEGEGGAGRGGGDANGKVCGSKVCAPGLECCNASCGTCTPPGGVCTQQACEPAPGEGNPAPKPPFCGGIGGFPCKGGSRCVDDPSDDCDPRRGGADCGGICVCEGLARCRVGYRFDKSPEVCACVPIPEEPPPQPEPGVQCGKVTCAAGQECCNASCSTCVEKGGACTQQVCEPEPQPEPVTCGTTTCGAGETCCNASCGICTKPGEGCTKQLCPTPEPGDEPIPGMPCDTKCEVGQHCEYEEVVCVRAPCPPLPSCVDTPQCGGFAGIACPGSGMCEDDPRDDCDPQNGGADCGGLCECQLQGVCKDGFVWNASPGVCGCVPVGGGNGGGEQCGKRTCGDGLVCCNASCGICTKPGMFCTQQACL